MMYDWSFCPEADISSSIWSRDSGQSEGDTTSIDDPHPVEWGGRQEPALKYNRYKS